MPADFLIGLDLGQTTDFTALAVLERQAEDNSATGKPDYALRHLQRYPLGTPYTTIVPAVTRLAGAAPLSGSPLVVDQTGVGRALVDMLRQAYRTGRVVPVTITGGQAVTTAADGGFHVPKKELVTCLQRLLQNRRLQIARSLPAADVLVQELQAFRVRITAAAHETFGAWRDGEHDDLVLAVALACWWGERCPRCDPEAIRSGAGIRADLPEGVLRSRPGSASGGYGLSGNGPADPTVSAG